MVYKITEFKISDMYKELRVSFGYMDWWPGESNDEIVIGAILTQQASWENVEKAIRTLKKRKMLGLRELSERNIEEIEDAIKASGFYRKKAARLKRISTYVINRYGSLGAFFDNDRDKLRKELLAMEGIGMETADAILLYAANKRIFVVDAYTRRIMSRVYGIDPKIEYEELRKIMEKGAKMDIRVYKDFHAQIVELGKRNCRKRPLCSGCPLKNRCNLAHSVEGRR